MSSEWAVPQTIGELLAREGGSIKTGPFGTTLKASEYVEVGVPLISVREIGHGTFHIDSKTPRVCEETLSRLPEYVLQENDIVFARKGGIERCALIRKPQSGWFLGSDGIRLRPPKSCDARFIAYSLQTQAVRDWLVQNSTGSTMASLNQATIGRLPIALPTIHEQVGIADTLESLDDRITLLRETNATLEAIAQALFKSWFVDFDPVRAKMEGRVPEGMDEATAALFPDSFEETELGVVPRGWQTCAVEDFAERVGMGPFGSNIKVETFVDSGVPVISGQHLKQLLVEDNTFNFITPEHAQRLVKSCVQAGDVIFTHAGSIGQVSLLHKDAAYSSYVLSQRQFFLRCKDEIVSPEWVVLYFKSPAGQHQLLANTSQVGVPSIARPVSYLRSIRLVIPPPGLNRRFASIAGSINDSVMANRMQLLSLATLRDTLLPRLISGQLRVPELQSTFEEALA